MARIIRQLAETDPAVAAGQTTDLNVLITTLLPLWERTLFAPNGIRVESHLQAQPARVAADPNSVKQVLLNLVKNAAEAMPAGGVFAITTSSGINRDGVASVAVQIADSGSGIPPEIVARLFSPVETGKAGEHSGLGLSICREILKGLNGSISCRNGERGGACFEILLPQA